MEPADTDSIIERRCGHCSTIDAFYLSKKEIAFNLYSTRSLLEKPCSNCGSTTDAFLNIKAFYLGMDILKEWALDADLHLMPQDEELLLGDEEYFDRLLDLLDHYAMLPEKQHLIFEAFCIIIYDSLLDENNRNLQLAERVKTELLKRRNKFMESGPYVLSYLTDVVYPFLEPGSLP